MEPTLAAAPHLVAVLEGPRVTRRATVWRRSTTGRKILYHQGTLVDPAS
jgi:hypothetical protein